MWFNLIFTQKQPPTPFECFSWESMAMTMLFHTQYPYDKVTSPLQTHVAPSVYLKQYLDLLADKLVQFICVGCWWDWVMLGVPLLIGGSSGLHVLGENLWGVLRFHVLGTNLINFFVLLWWRLRKDKSRGQKYNSNNYMEKVGLQDTIFYAITLVPRWSISNSELHLEKLFLWVWVNKNDMERIISLR